MKRIKIALACTLAALAGVVAAQQPSGQSAVAAQPYVIDLPARSMPGVQAKPVVIDFSASWCGPCRMFAPTFEAAAKARAGKAVFMRVDVDSCQEAAIAFGVRSIPQVAVLLPDTTVVMARPGLMDAATFDAFLDQALSHKGN